MTTTERNNICYQHYWYLLCTLRSQKFDFVVEGVPQTSAHCPPFSKNSAEDEFQDVDDEEGWWFMLQNQDCSPLQVKIETKVIGKSKFLPTPQELPTKGQISISLRYNFIFSQSHQSQPSFCDQKSTTENDLRSEETSFQNHEQKLNKLHSVENLPLLQSKIDSDPPKKITDTKECSGNSLLQQQQQQQHSSVFSNPHNHIQNNFENVNICDSSPNQQTESFSHSPLSTQPVPTTTTISTTTTPNIQSHQSQTTTNVVASSDNKGSVCFELPFAEFHLELDQSPNLKSGAKKRRPQRLCHVRRGNTEGFFHVDRQRSHGKTDFCVIHFSNNQILAIRIFLPTDKLPPQFRMDPEIAETLRKKKTRKIKFVDDEHLEEIHYFSSRSPPAFHFSQESVIDSDQFLDPDTMNVYELRNELRLRNLPTRGKKKELVVRLKQALSIRTDTNSSSLTSHSTTLNTTNQDTAQLNNVLQNYQNLQNLQQNEIQTSVPISEDIQQNMYIQQRKRRISEQTEENIPPKKQTSHNNTILVSELINETNNQDDPTNKQTHNNITNFDTNHNQIILNTLDNKLTIESNDIHQTNDIIECVVGQLVDNDKSVLSDPQTNNPCLQTPQ